MTFNNDKAVEIYAAKNNLFPVESKIFDDYLKEPQKILDLGCGTGRTTRPLADMGHKVVGVDVAPLMVTKARELHPDISFQVMDAVQLRFSDKMFDCVLFSFNGLDCLYPFKARMMALREIHRVLKKRGLFIYSSHDSQHQKISWRTLTRIRNYDHQYKVESTVYGDLILYYGSIEDNNRNLRQMGFNEIRHYPLDGKMWRYYVCRRY